MRVGEETRERERERGKRVVFIKDLMSFVCFLKHRKEMDGYKKDPWRLLKIHLTGTRGGPWGSSIVRIFYEYTVVARVDCERCVILQRSLQKLLSYCTLCMHSSYEMHKMNS